MIEIVAHRPAWAELYENEAVRLRQGLGPTALRIEHVGSTAVPGLAAKNIVDIQISVASLRDGQLFASQLEALGYVDVPDDEPAHRFFKLVDEAGHRLVHIHVCAIGSEWERRHIFFRDYLRKHPETVREYEDLKKKLASRFDDINEYADAKTDFIRRIEELDNRV